MGRTTNRRNCRAERKIFLDQKYRRQMPRGRDGAEPNGIGRDAIAAKARRIQNMVRKSEKHEQQKTEARGSLAGAHKATSIRGRRSRPERTEGTAKRKAQSVARF